MINSENQQHSQIDQQSESERKILIQQTIKEARFIHHPEKYSRNYDTENHFIKSLMERYPEFDQQLSIFIKNKTLIDLGCGFSEGRGIPEYILDLAIKYEAKKYIGVDADEQTYIYPPSMEKKYKDSSVEIEVFCGEKGDMLYFLSSQPSNSANIMINGMDEIIIDMTIPANIKYIKLLCEEIKRVIGKDHRVFGIESEPIFSQLRLELNEHQFDDGLAPSMFWNNQE